MPSTLQPIRPKTMSPRHYSSSQHHKSPFTTLMLLKPWQSTAQRHRKSACGAARSTCTQAFVVEAHQTL